MDKKMLFVFNPCSGKGQIKTKLFEIIDIFIKGGYEVLVHPTQEPQDGYRKVKELADEVDLVVCSGGDGTLDEVVTALMEIEREVPLGYIPAGSTNDFANSLSIPKDMVMAARAIVEGECCPCDVGSFNSDTFVYVAAFGMFTDVSYQTDQNLKNLLGHVAYVLEGAKRIFDIKAYRVKAISGGECFEDEYIYGMVSNSRSIGGFKNLTAKRDVQMDDGLLEVTLIKRPKNPLELNEILMALMTRVDNTELIVSFKTDKIEMEFEEEIPWTLDGEFGGVHKTAQIEARKHAMKIFLQDQEEEEPEEGEE